MTGKDFLFLAKSLLKSDEESARRTSVSRSYYALFHQVKAKLNIQLKEDASAHGEMAHYLESSDLSDARYIGGKLKDLRVERNQADYDLYRKKFEKNHCTFQFMLAETLCNMLDSMPQKELNKNLTTYAKNKGDLI